MPRLTSQRPMSIKLSSSRAGRRPGFRPVVDKFELSRHVEIARTWSQTGSQLVCELLASWIAPNRPNSITLSSSLAGRIPAGEPARELDSVMEFGLKLTVEPTIIQCVQTLNLSEIFHLTSLLETGKQK